MSESTYDPKAQVGVHIVGKTVEKEMGWIFRNQLEADFGIDAQLEITDPDRVVTGQLIALQIKTGASFFKEPIQFIQDGWIFRPKPKHVRYWKNHCLPVAIVLVDDEKEIAYWQGVSSETLVSTGKGWKIFVPKSQVVNASAAAALKCLVRDTGGSSLRSQLALAKPWMDVASTEEGLWMEAEQWVNKMSGRSAFRLFTKTDGGEQEIHNWPYVLLAGSEIPDVLAKNFPWADISLDQEFYEEYEESQRPIFGEADYLLYEDDPFVYEEFDPYDFHPYDISSGELALYRFHLKLNEFGKAYRRVETFIATGDDEPSEDNETEVEEAEFEESDE